jgi:hypothetical protein
MKNILRLAMTLVLLVAGIPQSQAAPTPPQANSIVVSPTTIAPGGIVTVTFNVTSSSDIPVPSNSIVQFYAPSGANYGGIVESNGGTSRNLTWSAQIKIPTTAEGGKYSLSLSVPFDANGLSGGFVQTKDALTVTGSNSRPTPPQANNIVVSPKIVAPGGTVSVAFSVTSSSDVPYPSNSIVQFYAPSGANYGGIHEAKSGTARNQSWNALIQIPATAETGNYRLSLSVPFDANGLSGGFVQTMDALWVGTEADKIAFDKAAADKIAIDKAKAEKMAQDKAAADRATSLKKTTIICVKGKLTKKVTAVKPKCPTGYKKK